MNVRYIKLILSFVLVLLTMSIILTFSLQTGEKSSNTSTGVIEEVLNSVIGEENVTDEMVSSFQIPVRKMAHFGIYMLLGFTLINLFNQIVLTFDLSKYLMYVSFFVGILYAIFDEFVIQGVTTGRAPSWIDVLIDTSGVAIGIILFIPILTLTKKLNKK